VGSPRCSTIARTPPACFTYASTRRLPPHTEESHAEEESRLTSDKYQEDVAQAIALGVEDFLGRRQLAKVQVD
jgi:hypothetical protein